MLIRHDGRVQHLEGFIEEIAVDLASRLHELAKMAESAASASGLAAIRGMMVLEMNRVQSALDSIVDAEKAKPYKGHNL